MTIASERVRKIHGQPIHSEFALIATENDIVIATEYEDHFIRKNYEWHLLDDNGKCEYISHDNIDKNGDYYTSRKIIHLNKIGMENFKQYSR